MLFHIYTSDIPVRKDGNIAIMKGNGKNFMLCKHINHSQVQYNMNTSRLLTLLTLQLQTNTQLVVLPYYRESFYLVRKKENNLNRRMHDSRRYDPAFRRDIYIERKTIILAFPILVVVNCIKKRFRKQTFIPRIVNRNSV